MLNYFLFCGKPQLILVYDSASIVLLGRNMHVNTLGFSKMGNQNGSVIVSDERLGTLESEVRHINGDIGEIKGKFSHIEDKFTRIEETNNRLEKSIAVLTHIAEQNQKIEPKIEEQAEKFSKKIESVERELGNRITTNERFIWKAGGALAVIATLAPFALKWIFEKLG